MTTKFRSENVMRTMHLFAGHGGGLLADLILGHTPVVAVEWDRYACQVLRERAADGWFPGLSVWEGDVRLFDPSEYTGSVDIIHAGFPCQDISVAGKQAGVGPETRSGLYREVLRIASVVRPKQLFLENVSGIVSNGLETVLADLAALGYDSEWVCLRASDCGANHRRDRWWLLANASLQHGQRWSKSQQSKCGFGEAWIKSCGCCSEMAYAYSTNSQGGGETDDTQGREKPHGYAGLGRGKGWWETEPNVGRVANGVPNRVHRLKGLGNAQVPLQAAVAYKLLGGI